MEKRPIPKQPDEQDIMVASGIVVAFKARGLELRPSIAGRLMVARLWEAELLGPAEPRCGSEDEV